MPPKTVDAAQSMAPEAWDTMVAGDPGGHLLQTWAWGDLKARFGWEALRLAVMRDGSAVAGLQVLYRRLGPISMAYVPKGPVLLDDDPAVAQALWEGVEAASRRRRALWLTLEPEWRDGDQSRQAQLALWGFSAGGQPIQPRRTVIVDLQADEEAILGRMKSKWRYNVRLSGRKGIVVRQGGAEDVATFHTLLRTTGERDAFGVHSLAYYQAAYELFICDGRVALLLAEFEDAPVAGLMAYQFNGQSWYMYGASANRERSRMPNHGLQWQAMRWAKGCGCRQYDLWGITDQEGGAGSRALSGVERFKLGFGGEVVRYLGAYDRPYRPALYRLAKRALAWRANR